MRYLLSRELILSVMHQMAEDTVEDIGNLEQSEQLEYSEYEEEVDMIIYENTLLFLDGLEEHLRDNNEEPLSEEEKELIEARFQDIVKEMMEEL